MPHILSKKMLLALVILSAVFFISIFGVWHSFGVEMKNNGEMSGCPFMGITTICKMGIIEHIAQWQNVFIALAHQANTLALLLMVLVLLVSNWHILRLLKPQYTFVYKNPSPDNSYLLRAFSRGILNPKIYESALL